MKLRRRPRTPMMVPTATMADITFLLIIFFLLVTTFAKDTGLNINLPRARTTQELPKREVTIWVTAQGGIRVDDVWINPRDLTAVLAAKLQGAHVRAVTIRGDERVPYGTVVTIMDAATLLGAEITLAAEVQPAPATPPHG